MVIGGQIFDYYSTITLFIFNFLMYHVLLGCFFFIATYPSSNCIIDEISKEKGFRHQKCYNTREIIQR